LKAIHRLWLFALTALAMGSCSTNRAAPGREVFDEQTGNTLTVVSKPLVFARDRNDVAAYARDYATAVAVEVDHSGTLQDYLLVYRWSTVDKRMLPGEDPGAGTLRLIGAGRELTLQPLDSLPVDVAVNRSLHLPGHDAAVARAYAVDVDILRFIAHSDTLTLELPEETLDTPFRIWEDGRGALEQFMRQTAAP
jgi:hypothetical protein